MATAIETAAAALQALMPALDATEASYRPAFRRMAEVMLDRAILWIAQRPHRVTEIELYFHGGHHADRFTHGDDMQRRFGRWYFHRSGQEFRSGTYKGLDLAIGNDTTTGGILLRGAESLEPGGALLDGPCVLVDYILATTRHASIRELVATFDLSSDPRAGDQSPLYLTLDAGRGHTIYETARVGLTLKRGTSVDRQRYLAMPYRFLVDPKRIKKGKPHVVLALHRQGRNLDEVARITGSPRSTVAKYVELYEAGRTRAPAEFGRCASVDELCGLLGACHNLVPA